MNSICTHYFFISGFEKCSAAKRLEALQKKLVLGRDRDCKELNVQKDNSPVKTHYGPESGARGMLQHSQTVVSIHAKSALMKCLNKHSNLKETRVVPLEKFLIDGSVISLDVARDRQCSDAAQVR